MDGMEDMKEDQMEAGGEGGGDIVGLAKQGADILGKLAQAVDASPQASQQDKAEAAQVMDLFMGLAERMLGGGGEPKAEPMGADMVPADAGMKGIPAGPQGRV